MPKKCRASYTTLTAELLQSKQTRLIKLNQKQKVRIEEMEIDVRVHDYKNHEESDDSDDNEIKMSEIDEERGKNDKQSQIDDILPNIFSDMYFYFYSKTPTDTNSELISFDQIKTLHNCI